MGGRGGRDAGYQAARVCSGMTQNIRCMHAMELEGADLTRPTGRAAKQRLTGAALALPHVSHPLTQHPPQTKNRSSIHLYIILAPRLRLPPRRRLAAQAAPGKPGAGSRCACCACSRHARRCAADSWVDARARPAVPPVKEPVVPCGPLAGRHFLRRTGRLAANLWRISRGRRGRCRARCQRLGGSLSRHHGCGIRRRCCGVLLSCRRLLPPAKPAAPAPGCRLRLGSWCRKRLGCLQVRLRRGGFCGGRWRWRRRRLGSRRPGAGPVRLAFLHALHCRGCRGELWARGTAEWGRRRPAGDTVQLAACSPLRSLASTYLNWVRAAQVCCSPGGESCKLSAASRRCRQVRCRNKLVCVDFRVSEPWLRHAQPPPPNAATAQRGRRVGLPPWARHMVFLGSTRPITAASPGVVIAPA